MIVIPDLFGSYQRGREEAIKNNWNDLAQYESIESSRHQNDAQALANLATMADFGHKRQMTSNEATNSNLAREINEYNQAGKIYNAKTNELIAGYNYGTLDANRDMVQGIMGNNLLGQFYNSETGVNNADTTRLNSTIVNDVTREFYGDSLNAARAGKQAANKIAVHNATYGPGITEQQLKNTAMQGVNTGKQLTHDYLTYTAKDPYVYDTAKYTAQAAYEAAKNSVHQNILNGKTINKELQQFDLKSQAGIISDLITSGTAAGLSSDHPYMQGLFKEQARIYGEQFSTAGGNKKNLPSFTPIVSEKGEVIGMVDNSTGAVTNSRGQVANKVPTAQTGVVTDSKGNILNYGNANWATNGGVYTSNKPTVATAPTRALIKPAKANSGQSALEIGSNWFLPGR